jgi:hypothetical protein
VSQQGCLWTGMNEHEGMWEDWEGGRLSWGARVGGGLRPWEDGGKWGVLISP